MDNALIYFQRFKTEEERFWEKADKSGDCWNWIGAVNSKGRANFMGLSAPRKAWKLSFGPIPSGMYVCHHCDNPKCVNPSHLFLGTQHDNMADMIRKGRRRRMVGDGAANRKITSKVVDEIRRSRMNGLSYKALAEQYGVCKSQIGRIVRGEHWQ